MCLFVFCGKGDSCQICDIETAYLPKSICDDIICKGKIHLVLWDVLCLPKNVGRFGVEEDETSEFKIGNFDPQIGHCGWSIDVVIGDDTKPIVESSRSGRNFCKCLCESCDDLNRKLGDDLSINFWNIRNAGSKNPRIDIHDHVKDFFFPVLFELFLVLFILLPKWLFQKQYKKYSKEFEECGKQLSHSGPNRLTRGLGRCYTYFSLNKM